jgi:hypothetical protein
MLLPYDTSVMGATGERHKPARQGRLSVRQQLRGNKVAY